MIFPAATPSFTVPLEPVVSLSYANSPRGFSLLRRFCPSARRFATGFLQILPRESTLALS
ncbi:MAG: hypothetical protein ACKO3I_10100 [Synechococcales cyanobacterium]